MKNTIVLVLIAIAVGCVSNVTDQTDESTSPDGTRHVKRTKTTANALLAGKQAIKGQRVSQSDKTQTASVGESSQESDAEPLATALGKLAIKGLTGASGVPAVAP